MSQSPTDISWKEIAEAVGILAIVASLVFVGLQLRQEHNIANAELQNEMIAIRTEVNNQVITNAHVLVKANDGEPLSQSEQMILREIVDSHWAEGFFGYRRWQFVDHPAVLAPVRGFSNFLHEHPAAREVWTSMPQNIGAPPDSSQVEFNNLVKARLAELSELAN